jgi:hypothetical protein
LQWKDNPATLRCGSVTSTPLLVMVVKPLNAKIDKTTEGDQNQTYIAARSAPNPDATCPKTSPQRIAMPPTFQRTAMIMDEVRPIGCQRTFTN